MKLGNFKDHFKARFTKEELAEIDREVALEAAALKSLQQNISDLFENYIKLNNLELNELARKLDLTPKKVLRIQSGQANILLGSLAILAARLGQELVVSFKKK
jgi:hypothetical protein